MGRFDRYVLGYFLSSFCLAAFFLIGLFLTMDALGKIDEFVDAYRQLPSEMRSSVPGYVLRYYLLSVPFSYLQFAPFIALLAILFTGVRLSQNNELVPIVAAGVSLFRIVAPLFATAALVAGSMLLVREEVVPRIEDVRDSLRDRLLFQRAERVYTSIRVPAGGGASALCNYFYPSEARVEDFILTSRGPGRLTYINAKEAVYRSGNSGTGWYLTEGQRSVWAGKEPPKVERLSFLEGYSFTPKDVYIAFKGQDSPTELSFAQLDRLSLLNPERRSYVTLLHFFLTFPLMNLILPLLGLPFVLRFVSRSSAEGIAVAFLIFAAYFGIDFYLRNLGDQGSLHPLVASWLPVVLFGSLGIVLFDSMRT